jgi:RNA polymerase sigma-70 factor (ECF subfamily)
MTDADDTELVQRAIAREPTAVANVTQRIAASARRAAKRLGLGAPQADDIAQRVAERLWLGREGGQPALASFTAGAPLDAWLKVIAYREGVNMVRGREAPTDDEFIDRLVGNSDPQALGAKRATAAVFKRCVSAALRELSLHEKELLRMHFLQRTSIDDLAHHHEVHRGTIARWLAQARQRVINATQAALRTELAGDAELGDVLALVASQLDVSLSSL